MTGARDQAWLGDLARVFGTLTPDDARDRAVAEMLGLTRPPARASATPSAAPAARAARPVHAAAPISLPAVPPVPIPSAAEPQSTAWEPSEPVASPEPRAPAEAPAQPLRAPAAERAWLPILFPSGRLRPAGSGRPWAGAGLPAPNHRPVGPEPAHQLFAPRSSAAILQRISAQEAPDGPVDLPALIDRLAHGRPVRDLPRNASLTLRFGVEVLIDQGAGIELFGHDVRDLLTEINRVVGSDRVAVSRFAYAPLRGAGAGPRRFWRPYRPGSPRVRVLVVSDFGMGGSMLDYRQSGVDEWTAFARVLHRHGSGAVALTPYPRRLWPRWLPALMPVLPWDRKVTVGQVAALLSRR
jgi:hypothetical protein